MNRTDAGLDSDLQMILRMTFPVYLKETLSFEDADLYTPGLTWAAGKPVKNNSADCCFLIERIGWMDVYTSEPASCFQSLSSVRCSVGYWL
jgi:hypothetical protein